MEDLVGCEVEPGTSVYVEPAQTGARDRAEGDGYWKLHIEEIRESDEGDRFVLDWEACAPILRLLLASGKVDIVLFQDGELENEFIDGDDYFTRFKTVMGGVQPGEGVKPCPACARYYCPGTDRQLYCDVCTCWVHRDCCREMEGKYVARVGLSTPQKLRAAPALRGDWGWGDRGEAIVGTAKIMRQSAEDLEVGLPVDEEDYRWVLDFLESVVKLECPTCSSVIGKKLC
ncbi:hypothetical protein NMY22_g4007 [Coprinellus aureogranulatus]|nr:hypothetical protein NMY22_g4007 [Coprinellus aureogranulatus]